MRACRYVCVHEVCTHVHIYIYIDIHIGARAYIYMLIYTYTYQKVLACFIVASCPELLSESVRQQEESSSRTNPAATECTRGPSHGSSTLAEPGSCMESCIAVSIHW